MEMVDWSDSKLPITKQAELLSINRSSLYYKPAQSSPEDVAMKHRINNIYTQFLFFGSRKIAEILKREGSEYYSSQSSVEH